MQIKRVLFLLRYVQLQQVKKVCFVPQKSEKFASSHKSVDSIQWEYLYFLWDYVEPSDSLNN